MMHLQQIINDFKFQKMFLSIESQKINKNYLFLLLTIYKCKKENKDCRAGFAICIFYGMELRKKYKIYCCIIKYY